MAAKPKTTPKLRPALPKTENGIVDYRSLINPKFIVLNKWAYGKEGIDSENLPPEEKERLKQTAEDSKLLILLGGFRELAQKRGVKSVDINSEYRDSDSAVAKCSITFLADEDDPEGVTNSDLGDANVFNTNKDFHSYLSSIASNRAYIRTVRNFFRIQALGWEEINSEEKVEVVNNAPYPVQKTLIERMERDSLTFDQIKEMVMASGKLQEWKEEWTDVKSLSPGATFVINSFLENELQ